MSPRIHFLIKVALRDFTTSKTIEEPYIALFSCLIYTLHEFSFKPVVKITVFSPNISSFPFNTSEITIYLKVVSIIICILPLNVLNC